MVGKDNAVEFTETKYCSRREMSNELGILIPEEMWKKVLNYRQVYNISLNLRDAENRDLVYCFYPTLASKCSQLENKVLRLQGEVQNLNTLNGDQAYFKLSSEALCLKALAVNRKYPLEEQRLRKLIASENAFDDAEEKLLNYHEALEYIRNRFVNKIDSDFLAELYSRILGGGDQSKNHLIDNLGAEIFENPEKLSRIERIDFNQIIIGTTDSIAEELLRDYKKPGENQSVVIEEFVAKSAMMKILIEDEKYLNKNLSEYLKELSGKAKLDEPSKMSEIIIEIKNRIYYVGIKDNWWRWFIFYDYLL